MNFSGKFQPDRTTRFGSFAHVLIYPKDVNESILQRKYFDEIVKLDSLVHNITIRVPKIDDRPLTYADLCARWGDECFQTETWKLNAVIDAFENKTMNLTWPVSLDEGAFHYIILPGSIGKPVLNNNTVVSTPAVGLFFILNAQTEKDLKLGDAWEEKFIEQMQIIAGQLKLVDIFYESSQTVEVEFDGLKRYVPKQGVLAGVIVVIFSFFSCMMSDWVKAKPMLGFLGVVSTVFGTMTAYGFLMSIGYPFTTVLLIVPFLMLGKSIIFICCIQYLHYY
jgi:hypothetical protein